MKSPPDSPPRDRLLTLTRVSALTGYPVRSLRRWCARGRIPGAWQPAGREGAWYVPAGTLELLRPTPSMADVADLSEHPEALRK